MRRLLILSLLFAAPVCQAQVVEAQAGASTLFNATGGSVALFFPTSTVTLGAGVSNGKLVAGASDEFEMHGWQIVGGDQQLQFSSEGASLSLATRGLSATRKFKHSKLTVFLSSCGQTFSAPYFSALRTEHFCTGYDFRSQLLPSLEFASFAVDEGKKTAIESLSYRWRPIKLAGSAGILNGSLFLNGSAAVQVQHFNANAQRQTTIFEGETFSTTSFSASATMSNFQFHIADFISRVSGQSAGVGVQVGSFTVREDFQHSGTTSILSSTLIAKLSRRIQLTGSANDSQGRWSASEGVQYTSNLAVISASNSIQYTPLRGFVKVFSAGVTLQLPHSTSLTASTVTLPNGKAKYSVYGGSYAQGPYAGAAQSTVQHSHNAGKYVYAGAVRDTDGIGVEGAAVQIGSELAITDSQGRFFVRAKKPATLTVKVLPDEFIVPGTWQVISAPSSAVPDAEIQIVVRRK